MESYNETKSCPYCGEQIRAGAKKCRFCNEWLEEPPAGYLAAKETASTNSEMPTSQPQNNDLSSMYPAKSQTSTPQNNTVTVNYNPSPHNGIGTAGFIFALLSLLFSWAPVLNWIVWFLGAFLSFVGMFKRPRGLAVVGFLISFITVIIIVTVVGAAASFLSGIF